jgi:hypothetical protein
MKKTKLKKLTADLFKKSTIKTEQKANIKGGVHQSTDSKLGSDFIAINSY